MRHPYSETCECKHCAKEKQRRLDQANSNAYFRARYSRDTRSGVRREKRAEVSREARILEHGYQNYAREEGHYD